MSDLNFRERIVSALITEKMDKYIAYSFEEAKNNDRRKNVVLLEDKVYITFKANGEDKNNVFGELTSWTKDEVDKDEAVYQSIINTVVDLFSFSDDELSESILECADLVEMFTKCNNKDNTYEENERDGI